MEELQRAGRGGAGWGSRLSPREETNTGRGSWLSSAFDFACLPSPGRGQIEVAIDIIFRTIFK